MIRQKKDKRIVVRLTNEQNALMVQLMKEKLETNASGFLASLLVRTRDCIADHGKNKVGRPRASWDDELPPFVMPQEDTLSFTPEELEQIRQKSLKNRSS